MENVGDRLMCNGEHTMYRVMLNGVELNEEHWCVKGVLERDGQHLSVVINISVLCGLMVNVCL